MAAPAIVALLAFLGGSQVAGLSGLLTTTGVVVADVDGAVVDLAKLCKATDPLIDALSDAYPKSLTLSDIVRAADKVCQAAAGGPGVATDAKLVGFALTAISNARVRLHSAAATAAIPDVPTHRATGR